MRFGEQFEFHKIPEWYNIYLDYELLRKIIERFKEDSNEQPAIVAKINK